HERDRLTCRRTLLGVGADERHAVAGRLVVVPDPADRTQIGFAEVADEALEEAPILSFKDRLGAGELRVHEELEHRQGLRPEVLREPPRLPGLLPGGLGQVGEDERAGGDLHIVEEGGKFPLEFIPAHPPSASGRGGGALESAGAKRPTSQGWAGPVRSDGPVFLRLRAAQPAATSWLSAATGPVSPLRRG